MMTTYYGYAGNILYVDLTTGQCHRQPLDMALARTYLGGCGIGERLLYDFLQSDTDPLSPDNPIIISAGTLVGTAVPGSSKIQMLTKSSMPSDSRQSKYHVGRASAGSRHFGVMMKGAGYDLMVITGRARQPVYLQIQDDQVALLSAADLWGNGDIYETSDELTRRHPGSGVIAIGRAGENMVPFALGWVDKMCHIGKHGGAAVMGSKNLKAIVVRGTQGVKVWDGARLKELAQSATRQMMASERFKGRRLSQSSYSFPPDIYDHVVTTWKGCAHCVYACKSSHQITDGELAGTTVESMFSYGLMLGGKLGLTDYQQAMRLVVAGNRYGICMMTVAGMLRFVTRLYERGLITTRDTDGLELKTGDIGGYLALLEKIVDRYGIGDTMARGWWAIAERFGVNPDTDSDGDALAKGCTVHISALTSSLNSATFSEVVNTRPGQELHPITMVRNLSTDAIRKWCRGVAMSPQEIARTVGGDDYSVGRLTKHTEDGEGVYWALGVCILWVIPEQVYNLKMLADMNTAATGIELKPRQLKQIGERIWNLGKLINMREGFTRADDLLPGMWARAIEESGGTTPAGPYLREYFGRPVTPARFEQMLDDYYGEHGWDVASGLPTEQKLAELGLDQLVR